MVLELDFNIAIENLIYHFQTLERILWDGSEASGSSNTCQKGIECLLI